MGYARKRQVPVSRHSRAVDLARNWKRYEVAFELARVNSSKRHLSIWNVLEALAWIVRIKPHAETGVFVGPLLYKRFQVSRILRESACDDPYLIEWWAEAKVAIWFATRRCIAKGLVRNCDTPQVKDFGAVVSVLWDAEKFRVKVVCASAERFKRA